MDQYIFLHEVVGRTLYVYDILQKTEHQSTHRINIRQSQTMRYSTKSPTSTPEECQDDDNFKEE